MTNQVYRCSITRQRALELNVVQKAVFLVPSLVKQRILQTINEKLVITFPSNKKSRAIIKLKQQYLFARVYELYEAEIKKRTDTTKVELRVGENLVIYVDKRETCLLDELRFSWFQYIRYIESLGIRAATSEIAIGNIATELPTAEWNNAINQFERSIHEGILMLNSDGSDLKFVTRNFSSAVDLTSIFLEHFLMIAGLPEEILFGKTSSSSGFSEKVPVQVFGINMLIENLAIRWAELEPELEPYYNFTSVETWMGDK
jgi:hypothetical protein